ncbi:serine/threonine protein kinase [Actinospica durhamensis]|uniref:Serine/threonine protein kinase n=1 Tax=Actinospica durhamensis TaxID=1508375 RepID=A0A941INE8_9ACTN|nr:serine/threonine-protein kinase [Actinospica durhamensis]MBR7833894.1 serine/threonine protein kinase [Actinospica durhamensis]
MTAPFEGFSQLEPGAPTEVGRYQLYARLGAGGMGQVFLSFLPGGRPVALKVVRAEFSADPEFRRRFAQEARAAQQVNGIHIAQLLDADPTAATPWLATAYIPGPSLLEAVRLHGPLPVASVRLLVAGIAQALDAIHAAGLIHRDLKPANVILAADGPRVIDFGIARAADATTASLTGKRVGSPQYMAPEQIRGMPATPALDVFALGALAYFAATGRAAFGEGEDLAVIFRIVQEAPDLTGAPPELAQLIGACLAKDPAARPDTAAILRATQVTAAEATNAGATGAGWLPPVLAQTIVARTNAIAALAAPPPPVPQPTVPMPPGGFATGTRQLPAAARPLGARLKVGAITLAFGVLIGAVAALAVFRSPGNGNTADSGPGTPTPSISSPAGSGPVATDGSSTPATLATGPQVGTGEALGTGSALPNAGSDTIQWQGSITFGKNGVSFDDIPPNTSPMYSDLSYVDSSNSSSGYNFAASWGMAPWTGSGVPSRAQCASLINGSSEQGLVAPDNALICVKSLDSRPALVQIQSVDTTNGIVSAYARVWAQPMNNQ